MQDFDAIRQQRIESDRSFKLGGETFVAAAFVAPEVIAEWSEQAKPPTQKEQIQQIDAVILRLLEPGQEKLWRKVRDPKVQHPVTLSDLNDLVEWLMETQTNRPTVKPSGSSESAGTSATSSKAGSSLRAVGA